VNDISTVGSDTSDSTVDESAAETKPPVQFADLKLSSVMHGALRRAKYHEPSAVQAGVIPVALEGLDVLGQARTGTGKTASFAIPILERMTREPRSGLPWALILVPTRELAVQVRDEIDKLSHGRKVSSVPLYGGKPIRSQITKLNEGADIIVGTPGRVLDHLSRGTLNTAKLQCVVLDEADRMLDIGFRPDIEKILRKVPNRRQTLLLSATVAPEIERLAAKYMKDPVVLDFSPKTKMVETIEQFYFTVDKDRKFDLLVALLEREQPAQAIVFCRTKRGTEKIQLRLKKKHAHVDCIHGDMVQNARDRVMKQFRAGDIKILVATDVVGRGIDVSSISHIINYDIPQSSDDYVHRVGRTARMGREGVAYTFVTSEEGNELTRIEILINTLLKRDTIEGFEATTVAAPQSPDGEGGEGEAKPKSPPGARRGRKHRRGL
jgi:ATP-dependent RNA helicase DeaD